METSTIPTIDPTGTTTSPAPLTLEPIRREDQTVDWELTRTELADAFADVEADSETGQPAWVASYNQMWETEQNRADTVVPVPPEPRTPGLSIAEWSYPFQAVGGLVLDADLATTTRCVRIVLDEASALVYSPGIVGALNQGQVETYCALGFDDERPTDAQMSRLSVLAKSAATCALEANTAEIDRKSDVYHTCLGKSLKQAGVALS